MNETGDNITELNDLGNEYDRELNLFLQEIGFSKDIGAKETYLINSETVKKGYDFIDIPLITETAEKIDNKEFAGKFFSEKGYEVLEPKSVINRGGSTLFTTSGVQVLDGVIFQEEEPISDEIFVQQPVIRTQYIDSVDEGVSTSFINMSLEKVNPSIRDHFDSLRDTLDFFEQIGISRTDINFKLDSDKPTWGSKQFSNRIVRIFVGDLEIGDAVYMYDIEQNSRQSLTISDIGLGLERVRWVLEGGGYFGKEEKGEINPRLVDYSRTLALMVASGLKPSNKEQGYRVRLFSKRLMRENIKHNKDINSLIEDGYDYWKNWTDLELSKEETMSIIERENERNLNAELLSILKNDYRDVNIDINQTKEQVLKALRGTSVDSDHLDKLIKKIYG